MHFFVCPVEVPGLEMGPFENRHTRSGTAYPSSIASKCNELLDFALKWGHISAPSISTVHVR